MLQEELVNNIWCDISSILRDKFDTNIYNSWLSKLNFVSSNNTSIILSVETAFIKEWISREYLSGTKKKVNGEIVWIKKGISQILLENFGIKNVEIIVDKTTKIEPVATPVDNVVSISEHNNVFTIGTELNKLYTFENFVIGDSNKLAHSIAQSIVDNEDMGFSVNPFFIYGGVGLGKTHLMQSMAWKFKEKYTNKNIVYLSAEKFMFLFVQSLQNKDINSFKEKFRNVDILLIDDIQFIAGKEGTQKEFFYTFNTLLSDGKQIIMACDRSPLNMENVDNQLKSRMSGGIIVDVTAPDYEMRLKLAKKKAEILGLSCGDEVFEYVAKTIDTTNRDIDGAIKKLLVHQKFVSPKIDLVDLENIFGKTFCKAKIINIEIIKSKVSEFFGISKSDLASDKRDKKFAIPRHIAFYLSRELTKKSFPDIAKEFGNKTHATVMHGCKKIDEEMVSDKELMESVEKIRKMI